MFWEDPSSLSVTAIWRCERNSQIGLNEICQKNSQHHFRYVILLFFQRFVCLFGDVSGFLKKELTPLSSCECRRHRKWELNHSGFPVRWCLAWWFASLSWPSCFFPFLCLCFRTSLFFSGFERCCSLPVAPSGSQPHSRLELRASGTLWPSVCVTTRSNVLRWVHPCYPHYSLFIICTTRKTSFILAQYWFSSSPVVLVV